MTTSGATSFNPAALTLITEAFALIRVGIGGEPLTVEDTDTALLSLNLMVKAWQADGLHLWTKSEAVLFLVADQAAYALGGTGTTANCALASDVVQTALSAAAIAGATSISVDSITGIADADHIGIALADGTLQWTTVNGTPAGSAIALDAALTGAASAAGVVYAYTTKLLRPTRLLSARSRASGSNVDVPITIIERPDYFDQPNKTLGATVTMVYYDPQLVTGQLYVWSAASVETDTIRFTFERPLEQFDALTNTADLPQEWLETLTYNLAYRLSPKYSFPLNERALLRNDALAMKEKLLGFDREYGSVNFQPDFTGGGGYESLPS